MKKQLLTVFAAGMLLLAACGGTISEMSPEEPQKTAETEAAEKNESEPDSGPVLTGVSICDTDGETANDAGDIILAAEISREAQLDGQYISELDFFSNEEGTLYIQYSLMDEPPGEEENVSGEAPAGYSINLVSCDPESGEFGEPVTLGTEGYIIRSGDLLWNVVSGEDGTVYTGYQTDGTCVSKFTVPDNTDGAISRDGTAFWYVSDGLMRLDIESGEIAELSADIFFLPEAVLGCSVCGGSEYILAEGLCSDLVEYYAAFDAETEELVWLQPESIGSLYLQNGAAVLNGNDGNLLTCSSDTPIAVINETGRQLNACGLSDGNILVYNELYTQDGAFYTLFLRDGETGESRGKSSVSLPDMNLIGTPSALADGSVLLVSGDSGGNLKLYRWMPDGNSEDNSGITAAPAAIAESLVTEADGDYTLEDVTPAPVPDSLSDLRERADELEEKYGVGIYISTEVLGCRGGYLTEAVSDYDTVSAALDTLDRALSKYPEGFFAQLVEGQYDGIDFYLTGTITGISDDVLGYAGGFQIEEDGRMLVLTDCTYPALYETCIHHELSHAIESAIVLKTGEPLDEEAWSELNPKGFSYSYTYSDYESNSAGKYAYGEISDENVYFIDDYAETYPAEDRARLFEYAMMNDGTVRWSSCPRLTEKLAVYADWIREAFDSGSWDTPGWEQPLN